MTSGAGPASNSRIEHLLQTAQYDQIIRLARRQLRLHNRRDHEAYEWLALAYMAQQRKDGEAFFVYKTAVAGQQAPDVRILRFLADVEYTQCCQSYQAAMQGGKRDEDVTDAARAERMEGHLRRGWEAFFKGTYGVAASAAREAFRLDGVAPEAQVLVQEALAERRRWRKRCLALLVIVVMLAGGAYGLGIRIGLEWANDRHLHAADRYAEANRFDQALAEYQQIKAWPFLTSTRTMQQAEQRLIALGDKAAAAGDLESAPRSYEQALVLHPGSQEARQKKEELFKSSGNSIGMRFVLIPAGEFRMGSENGDSNEKPVHRVRISKASFLGKYEVTQAQWKAVMGNNPSYFKGDTLPVEQVSWEEAQEFIRRLNTKEGGTQYRLPTEAEWEYAARAGMTTAYSFGDDPRQIGEHAWFSENSGNTPHPVGQKKPNPWGLYDIHGNVSEWVQDWHSDDAYRASTSPAVDPKGPSTGSGRVGRGGGWSHTARHCRSAFRDNGGPSPRGANLGLRLLREVP